MDGEDKVQFSLAARITLSLEEDNEERISGEITAKGGDVEGGSVPRRRSRERGRPLDWEFAHLMQLHIFAVYFEGK